MKFEWDVGKDRIQRKKWGLGFEEAKEVFSHLYHESQKNDDPEQYRVIGCCRGILISLIYEERDNVDGSCCRLITFWKATETERKLYEEG